MQLITRAARSTLDATIPQPLPVVMQRLVSWVAEQRRFTLVDRTATGASMRSRPNWASWGARIDLRMQTSGGDHTLLHGRWTPSVPTTVIAWGQGERDLRAIVDALVADPPGGAQGR